MDERYSGHSIEIYMGSGWSCKPPLKSSIKIVFKDSIKYAIINSFSPQGNNATPDEENA